MLHRPPLSRGPLFLALTVVAALAVSAPAAAQSTLRPAGEPIQLVEGGFAHPVWSPDGTRLAFTRPGYTGLWVSAADGDSVRQLTDEPASGFGFAWSPDGSALLSRVARFEGARRSDAVKVFDVETGAVEAVTHYRARMPALPRWSADGSAILLPLRDGVEVFARPTEAGTPARPVAPTSPAFLAAGTALEAVRLSASGPQTERLLDDQRVLNAVASPDHAQVAFEVMGGDLHVMNADGSGLISLGPGHRPTWSPDGRWVAFMRTEDDGERFTASDLFAARADGSAIVALTQTPGRLEMNPSWAPDGRGLAFDDLDDGAIYLLPIAR
jgi:dipeptidyl aminopeptidase/acylaminoacyl peptidase